MASSWTDTVQRKQPHSQRGQLSVIDGIVVVDSTTAFPSTTSSLIVFDTGEQGAMSICWKVKSAVAVALNVIYQVSMGIGAEADWINVATVSASGGAQASGGITVNNSTGYLILNYTNDPTHMAFRHHRLLFTNPDTTVNTITVHGVAK